MWPDNPLMTAVTEFFNDPDHAVEMENLVLEPETVEVTVQQQAASSTEGARNSRFRANAGATGAKRQKAAGAAARTEVQWKKPELRGMLKDFKGVRSGVDSSKAGWLKTKSSKARLIFLPNIPPFAMEHLTEALCGNTKLAALLAICVLHQDMRIVGMLCDQCEAIPRGLLEAPSISATNQAAIDEFNQTMAEDRELKIRHSIVKLEKGVPPSGFNGKSARLLLNNWAKNPPLQGLQTFRRTGAYPSTYFCALYKLIATVEPNAAILPKLPEIADCVRHYALAALIHRKRVPAATDYDEYEKHSVWFAAKWRAQGFALKGYGWHCWATNATLFRKFQTLAIYDQSPVEGNNERINAFSRKIPKSTGAAYKLSDWAQGEEHIKAVAEDRKRRQKSTSRAILEMCEAATWDAEYCLGPGKGKLKERTSFTINSTLVEIDAAIKAGNVRDWKTVFVPITGAYMVIETLKSVRGSRCRRNADFSVEAQRRRADGAFAEYEQYYEGLPLIVLDEPVLTTEQTPQWLEENDKGSAERYRITSRLERKKAWREHIGTSVNDRWYSNAVRADRDEAKAVAAEKAKAAAAAAAAAAAQPGEEPEATEDELDKEPPRQEAEGALGEEPWRREAADGRSRGGLAAHRRLQVRRDYGRLHPRAAGAPCVLAARHHDGAPAEGDGALRRGRVRLPHRAQQSHAAGGGARQQQGARLQEDAARRAPPAAVQGQAAPAERDLLAHDRRRALREAAREARREAGAAKLDAHRAQGLSAARLRVRAHVHKGDRCAALLRSGQWNAGRCSHPTDAES